MTGEGAIHTASYVVTGMTCEHCVASVSEELHEIAGVTDVRVDLASGALEITSERTVSEDEVRVAVAEAGNGLA